MFSFQAISPPYFPQWFPSWLCKYMMRQIGKEIHFQVISSIFLLPAAKLSGPRTVRVVVVVVVVVIVGGGAVCLSIT